MARVFVAGLLWLCLVVVSMGLNLDAAQLSAMFESYKRDYKKAYSSGEEKKRLQCFKGNLQLIEDRNKADRTATHGINAFTDLCPEEFRAKYLGGLRPQASLQMNMNDTLSEGSDLSHESAGATNDTRLGLVLPTVDWRARIGYGAAQNQGGCGSCWAFSAVGALEAAYRRANPTRPYLKLSEGFLTQCSTGSYGCGGGYMGNAVDYVLRYGGIPSAATYPYTSGGGSTGSCSSDPKKKVIAARFISHLKFYGTSELNLAYYLNLYGPMYIGVAATDTWQTYRSGVISSRCTTRSINHGVTLVGLGGSPNNYYWIIRNSWGAGWGEAGHIRLPFGSDCNGITSMPGAVVGRAM